MKFFAFGFTSQPRGGFNDLLGECDTLEAARQVIEKSAAEHGGYWGSYRGHVVIFETDKFLMIEKYAARVVGNVDCGKVAKQLWTNDEKLLNEFISKLP